MCSAANISRKFGKSAKNQSFSPLKDIILPPENGQFPGAKWSLLDEMFRRSKTSCRKMNFLVC